MRVTAGGARALSWRTAAPLLLCTVAPPAPDLSSIRDLEQEVGSNLGLGLGPTVGQRLRIAWEAGWEEQANEIEALANDVAVEEPPLDLKQLLKDSENITDSSDAQRLERARAVLRELMRFWRYSTRRTDLASDSGSVDPDDLEGLYFSGENVTAEDARRQRRRLLQRHRDAGVVEYRIFGEVLARDDALLDALPGAELRTYQQAWRQLGGLTNLTGWADEFADGLDEELENSECLPLFADSDPRLAGDRWSAAHASSRRVGAVEDEVQAAVLEAMNMSKEESEVKMAEATEATAPCPGAAPPLTLAFCLGVPASTPVPVDEGEDRRAGADRGRGGRGGGA
jgi:hypothetical protein